MEICPLVYSKLDKNCWLGWSSALLIALCCIAPMVRLIYPRIMLNLYFLPESGIDHEVVAAADINTTANEIYKENFKSTKIITKCIEVWHIFKYEK